MCIRDSVCRALPGRPACVCGRRWHSAVFRVGRPLVQNCSGRQKLGPQGRVIHIFKRADRLQFQRGGGSGGLAHGETGGHDPRRPKGLPVRLDAAACGQQVGAPLGHHAAVGLSLIHILEEAEILEIIDHHRLADIQTASPIYFRNEPVGCTATIVAGMFQEKGLVPSEKLAGLMAAAIVSDTVMFKSPTCTERDRRVAERLARIAGISLEALSREIFSVAASDSRSAQERCV